MAKEYSTKELSAAMDLIASGDVPSWMNSIEKQAFALGVITETHIVDHKRCNGRGSIPSCNPYSDGAMCNCPGSTGKVISELGQAAIKVQFPEYRIRNYN